jgi:pimeloyl-ACP methyl ester carboxylesterase
MEGPMPVVRLNGNDLAYHDHGRGVPVVLMHGYGDTSTAWQTQVPALSARYRLITLDLRGHGETQSPEAPAAYSEAHAVADLAALLGHLGIDAAVIGGLSLGGYLSLAFALAHPALVRALILCDTGPGFRNPCAREDWNRSAHARADRLEALGLDALGRGPAVGAARGEHHSAAGLARAARGMLAQADSHVIDGLARIAVPTLVIVGADDTPFLAATDYMAGKIPHARKVVIPGAGHASNVDQPAAFNACVLAFLDEVVGAPGR